MSAWYAYTFLVPSPEGAKGCHIHIGVGFCVARSTVMGNAKASMRGTSNRYRLPRLSFYIDRYCQPVVFNPSAMGSLSGTELIPI